MMNVTSTLPIPESCDATSQITVAAMCLVGIVVCKKISEKLQRCLGFRLGAAVGIALVGALIYLLKEPVSDALGPGYEGWEVYAFLSVAPPVALPTAWLAEILIKYCEQMMTPQFWVRLLLLAAWSRYLYASEKTSMLSAAPSFS